MELILQRLIENDECVIGTLYIDGATECWTLELPIQFEGQENWPDRTCIPEGLYAVDREYSHRFNRMVPKLLDVPGRTQIEIHSGNTADDSHGCILLGQDRVSDTFIGNSRAALAEFYSKFDNALANGESVSIEIRNPQLIT